jgi:divalent metal cation (Fe/Co/Zn/Cd) transporter
VVEVKRLTLTEIEEIAERIAKTITEENKLPKEVQKIIEDEVIKASQKVFDKYYDEIPYKPKTEVKE